MQHTLAAVFDNRTSAQQAMDELVRCGFPTQDLSLKDSTNTSTTDDDAASGGRVETGDRDESFGESVMHFFSDLFGAHHADTHVYTEAVNRGNTVLCFVTDDQDKVERAADIIEAYGPVDIDEHESQWRAGGWTGAESMRSGSYAGASMQTGSPGSTGSSASSLQSGTAGMTNTGASGARSGMSTSTGSTASFGSQRDPLQGSSAPGNAMQGSSSYGSQQRDTSFQGSTGSMPASSDGLKMGARTGQTGGVRVYSRVSEGSNFLESEEGESAYRSHFMRHMATLGGTYDDYDPAYRYGSSMASDPVYRGRSWDDVEPTLRSDWETRNPGSAWERFKAAVRHGWERMTGDDDGEYRSHWAQNYGGQGSYEDYAPAYRYGSSMASTTYKGRNWDDVESSLRSDWETSNPGSTWERFKAAVRHGWDRMTGDDDGTYRNHWQQNYAGQGSYEDYAPAYRYGSTMASTTYKGRNWDDVEPSLRSDWETRNPNSAWERFKDAVRQGWDRITGDDEHNSAYRSHWSSNYANQGSSYDEYEPAYRYGSSMATHTNYRGREWDDVEDYLRSDWETRNPGSTWERFKAAVRHGWDRMTS